MYYHFNYVHPSIFLRLSGAGKAGVIVGAGTPRLPNPQTLPPTILGGSRGVPSHFFFHYVLTFWELLGAPWWWWDPKRPLSSHVLGRLSVHTLCASLPCNWVCVSVHKAPLIFKTTLAWSVTLFSGSSVSFGETGRKIIVCLTISFSVLVLVRVLTWKEVPRFLCWSSFVVVWKLKDQSFYDSDKLKFHTCQQANVCFCFVFFGRSRTKWWSVFTNVWVVSSGSSFVVPVCNFI